MHSTVFFPVCVFVSCVQTSRAAHFSREVSESCEQVRDLAAVGGERPSTAEALGFPHLRTLLGEVTILLSIWERKSGERQPRYSAEKG